MTGKPDLRTSYDQWHRVRLREEDPREVRFFSWIFDHLNPVPGRTLLDVACGQGRFLDYAREHGLVVSGCDLSEVAIEAARARLGNVTLEVADAEELPFPDASFDYVTCLGSLEHFPNPGAGAREMSRVLAEHGTAIVFVPNLYFLGHIFFGLRHGTQPSEGGQAFSELFLTSQGWRELLSGAGFEVRAFHSWNHIFASDKVGPATMKTWNALSRFVPRHGSYAFAFVCSKKT